MQPTSRGVAIVAAAVIVTGLAACSDNAVDRPTVPSVPVSAQPSPLPSAIESSPSALAASPSVAFASPSVAPSSARTTAPAAPPANPAKVVLGHPYRPEIDAAGFTTDITNRYLPLVPGTVWTYKGAGERVVTAVTSDTKWIMGVETVIVRDRGFENGSLTEDTRDYFAQDAAGNVWYFGEDTAECDNGQATSTGGAWIAGVDGAQPGVVMLAAPSVGQFYRQEYLRGEAEDVARVKKVDATTTTGSKTYHDTVVTEDFTALEPGNVEQKTYVPDLGLVESRYVKGGSGAEVLVDVKTGVPASSMASGKLCRT